jgi:anti-anti-sigma regulatory factor
MIVKINSYRADAKVFEPYMECGEDLIEFDLNDADYITSDGFAAIIQLKQKGKNIRLININEHIKETIELIKLEGII